MPTGVADPAPIDGVGELLTPIAVLKFHWATVAPRTIDGNVNTVKQHAQTHPRMVAIIANGAEFFTSFPLTNGASCGQKSR
jgi:hypothetical protein